MSKVVGVDIGGTFTDLVLLDTTTGGYRVNKVLTSTGDPARAVFQGIEEILQDDGLEPGDVEYVVHGTTIVANTLIERRGARTAVLITEGFEDLLEMRREQRYDQQDLFPRFPEPLVPAERLLGVRERVLADGRVDVPLVLDDLRTGLERIRVQDVEAVAVCLIHAYSYPEHERQVAGIVAQELPGVRVSVSSDVAPEIGEYERLSTTTANAYVQPVVADYLEQLQRGLEDWAGGGRLYVMNSDGGVTSIDRARQYPVRLLESGPAGGVAASVAVGERRGHRRLVALEMGGTTAKFCIVDDGRPLMTWEMEAARERRFKRGSGLPIRIPSVEMLEIGAGGGSIAHLDARGMLKVGPYSAGASPGPCCYGLGGTAPTVTDALAVLGYLNPANFLGGKLSLSVDLARIAIEQEIAGPLGLSVEDAALGIYRVACAEMAESMRAHFAERGKDQRVYTMIASGGAGPAHACEVARTLKIARVLVPPVAGIMSATGMVMAPFAFSVLQSHNGLLADADAEQLNAILADLMERGTKTLQEAGLPTSSHAITCAIDLRYEGQRQSLEVELPGTTYGPELLEQVSGDFERLHAVYFGRANPALKIAISALKVRATAVQESGWIAERSGEPAVRQESTRPAWFIGTEAARQARAVARAALVQGQVYRGPAIVEDGECTTVIGPHDGYQLDEDRNIVIEIDTEGAQLWQ